MSIATDLNGWHASRQEFLKLTGPTPAIPDWAFGTWCGTLTDDVYMYYATLTDDVYMCPTTQPLPMYTMPCYPTFVKP